jgi:hypothetical protein
MGWIIVYAKKDLAQHYNKYLRGIFNIILMPHTVMQSSIKGILNNPINVEYLKSKMEIMKNNKFEIKKYLSKSKYCQFGASSGALYGTIILNMN